MEAEIVVDQAGHARHAVDPGQIHKRHRGGELGHAGEVKSHRRPAQALGEPIAVGLRERGDAVEPPQRVPLGDIGCARG